MAASIQTVREKMDVKETPNNKGLICTIRVTAYDNGVLEVDGRPVSTIDPAHSWLSANEVIGMALVEFYRQCLKRTQTGK